MKRKKERKKERKVTKRKEERKKKEQRKKERMKKSQILYPSRVNTSMSILPPLYPTLRSHV